MPELDIYWGSGSPFSWRVLLSLEYKGINYHSHQLQFSKKEHLTDKILALNPRGKLPILKHGDFILTESLAIITYIDTLSSNNPLFSGNNQQQAKIWKEISEFDSFVFPVAMKIVRPIFTSNVEGKEEVIQVAARSTRKELNHINDKLQSSDWLADADSPSAADIAIYPFIASIDRLGKKAIAQELNLGFEAMKETFPSLYQWCQRIEQLPGYDKAYPPHWKD